MDSARADEPSRASAGSVVRGLLVTVRPRQWTKNLLVFGAPATGRVLFEPAALASATLAFLAFCLVASGTYIVNDIVDAPADRTHPVKRRRPIAAEIISPHLAAVVALILLAGGLAVAFAGGGLPLVAVAGGYVGLTLAYTYRLRDIVLLDIAAIAGGFLLRAVAGGVATGVPLSDWFLLVASFASLFLAAGKRTAEYVRLGDDRGRHRPSFDEYSETYLRFIQYSAATITIAGYALWSFEGETGGTAWSGLSIIPFVLGIFRYGLLLDKGHGAAPEEAILSDPPLLGLGVAWVLLVAVGVYVG